MKNVSKWLGLLSLIVILTMPFVYFFDQISFGWMTRVLLIATLVWYGTAFFWIGKPGVVDLQDDPLL